MLNVDGSGNIKVEFFEMQVGVVVHQQVALEVLEEE